MSKLSKTTTIASLSAENHHFHKSLPKTSILSNCLLKTLKMTFDHVLPQKLTSGPIRQGHMAWITSFFAVEHGMNNVWVRRSALLSCGVHLSYEEKKKEKESSLSHGRAGASIHCHAREGRQPHPLKPRQPESQGVSRARRRPCLTGARDHAVSPSLFLSTERAPAKHHHHRRRG